MNNDTLIDAMRALGHPLRLRIVQALATGEHNVGEIELATGIAQPGLSQQLAVLRVAGLVETRKAAKLVFYRLNSEALAAIATAIGGLSGGTATEPARRTPMPGAAHFARLA